MHGCMVYTEHAEMAKVSSGTSRVRTKTVLQLDHFGGYSNHAVKRYSYSFRVTCNKNAVSLLESGERRYIKGINNNNLSPFVARRSASYHLGQLIFFVPPTHLSRL